jgi:hypothetical protein
MPPADAPHPLTDGQKELVRQWIEQGAPYAPHWSFIPPQRSPLPDVGNADWVRNEIDAFVLARLEQAGLSPSPEADRYALIRRLSLDLRGLPPAPDEVEAFVADVRADAYERLVDRFLADAAYGERMARKWLDLARYADSRGYGFDISRSIWRYRDWVIDAFNRNLPYDQFTMEQLAGDLLEDPTLDQRIATAFHRNTMTNVEGVEDESRVAAVMDRAETTFQVWMGLTLGCAKCHNHKFDPLSHADYYQVFAFFNQTADGDKLTDAPEIPAPTPDQLPLLKTLDDQIATARREFDVDAETLAAEQLAWESAVQSEIPWTVIQPEELTSESGVPFRVLDDGSLMAGGEAADNDVYTITAHLPLTAITAIRLETLPDDALPNAAAGRADDGSFVLSKFVAEIGTGAAPSAAPPEAAAGDGVTAASDETAPEEPTRVTKPLKFIKAVADFSQAGFPIENAIHQDDITKSGWGVNPQFAKPHTAYFIAQPTGRNNEGLHLTVRLEQRYSLPRYLLGRFRLAATDSSAASSQLTAPAEIQEIVRRPAEDRTDEQSAKVSEFFRSVAPCLAPLREKVAEIEKRRPKVPTVPVLEERPPGEQRTTTILVQGNHLNPGEEVQPATPAAFPPLAENLPRSRLGLASWLMQRENPLTARVAVNRLWAQLFGIGLVETEEDFGTQGALPSHPELLDWLAVEFMEPGGSRPDAVAWDVKQLVRLMVTSATYRQSSHVTPDQLERDPRNRLLSRGPRFRLEAEMVRDQALALAGLLSRKMCGPSVYPPQPDGIWQLAFSFERNWPASQGEDRYRRGLYTFLRRSAPYPSMLTFDGTSRELCTVRRLRTNTPLQALVTLNDPVYVEAAQALARRIVREGGTTLDARARFGLQLCLVRPPTESQTAEIVELYENSLAESARDPDAARQLATDPLGPLPDGMDVPELAAWTVVANVLLNLDAVLVKN